MKDKEKEFTVSTVNLGTVLFLIFLTLKLAGVDPVSNWSWWWVTGPLWIPLAAVLLTLSALTMLGLIYKLFNK